jgi:hypothetical protein
MSVGRDVRARIGLAMMVVAGLWLLLTGGCTLLAAVQGLMTPPPPPFTLDLTPAFVTGGLLLIIPGVLLFLAGWLVRRARR